jgi:hypothetical protein
MGPYSSVVNALEGAVSFVLDAAGRLTESEPFQGALSISAVPSAIVTESEPLAGGFAFAPVFFGELHGTDGFYSNVVVSVVPAGGFTRVGSRDYDGTVHISVIPEGRLSVLWPMKADTLYVSVVLSGGADIYIGEFWKPDVPIVPSWVPDDPLSPFWVPDVPVQMGWKPSAPEREWGN